MRRKPRLSGGALCVVVLLSVTFSLLSLIPASRLRAQEKLPEAIPAHTAAVNAAVYTNDQRYVITAGADQMVRIWDAKTGEEIRTLAGHTGQVLGVAVSPDNRVLASSGADNVLRLWDIPQPDPVRTFAGVTLPERDVAVSPNGQWFVSVGDDKVGRVWRLEDGSLSLMLEGHTAELNAAAVRTDNNQIATGDGGGVIRLWGPLDGRGQGLLRAHVGAVRGLVFHPNNQQLVSVGDDGQLKVWQLQPVAPREFVGHTAAVNAVALNSVGQLAVTGGADGVRVFNPADGALVRELPGAEGATFSVGVSPNNALAAAAGDAGVVRFWNLTDGADRWRIAGHEGAIRGLAFHPDNARLATAGDDGTIRLWRYPVAPLPAVGHTADVVATVFSPNGQMAATVSLDKSVRGWNPTTGAALWQQPPGEQPLTRVAIRADSTQLAVGDAVGEVQLRSATDGTLAQSLSAHVGPVRGLAFHPAGEALATIGDDNCLKIWKLPLVAPQPLPGFADAVSAVAISADATRIVAGSTDKTIRVFDATSGQQTVAFAAVPDAVTSLALRGDDTVAAAGHAVGTIKLWNTADGSPWKGPPAEPAAAPAETEPLPAPAELFGHDGAVVDVAFDPAGQRIATAGADGTLRLWRLPEAPRLLPAESGPIARCVISPDGKLAALAGTEQGRPAIILRDLATGKIVQTLLGHEGAIGAIAFHHDGTKLVSGAADNTARVWNLADPKFPEVLKAVHPSAVSAVALSSDGTQLFSAAADNVIRCTSVADGAEVRTIPGHGGAIVGLRVVGTTLFSGSADATVRLWNTADGKAIRSINHGAAVTCFAVDAAGKTLVSGGAAKNVKLWNVADGAAIATLAGHAGPLVDVGFSADGARACSVSNDGLWLWDIAGKRRLESFVLPQGEQRGTGFHEANLVAAAADGSLRIVAPHLEQLIDAHAEGVNALAFTPDGARVVTSGADKTVKLWNLADGKPLATFAGATDIVNSVAITPDGKQLLGGGLDKTLRVWPLPAAAQAQPVAAASQWELPAAIASLRLGGEGKRAAIGGEDGVVRVWDWTIGRELERFRGHTAAVLDAAISADGQLVVSGSADKTARKSTMALAHVAVLETAPRDLAYLADGSQLIVAGESPALEKWQLGEAGLAAVAKIPADGAKLEGYVAAPQLALTVSGDAKRIAALDAEGRTNVWNAADGSLAYVVAAPPPPEAPAEAAAQPPATPEAEALAALVPGGDVQFSANEEGAKLVVGYGKQVRVLDAATGQFLERFDEPSEVAGVSVSPDGQSVLVSRTGAEENATLRRCSLERVIASHDGAVTAIAFTPDGNALVSGGDDKLVRSWNTADGQPVRSYAGSADAITCLAVTKDGQRILAGGLDKAVCVWPVTPAAEDAEKAAAGSAEPLPASATFAFPAAVRSVSPSFDNLKFAACSDDGVLRVCDLNSGVELERFTTAEKDEVEKGEAAAEGKEAVLAVAFAPDNRTLVAGGADNAARAWTMSLIRSIDVSGPPVEATEPTAEKTEETPRHVNDLVLANNGAQAVTASASGVKQWNLADGNLIRKFNVAPMPPAGAEGAPETTAAPDASAVEFLSVAVRGDNQQVVAADAEQRLWFWNLANGQQTALVDLDAPASRLRYSPDNQKIVALCADNHLRFFNPADGEPTYELTSDKPLAGVTFLADNRSVITGGAELREWLYASPIAVRTLTGHGGSVYSVTFSPDGRWIASTSADQTVRIWDAATGTQSKSLSGHVGPVYSSSFSPDGALLVSSGADKSVRLWDTLGGRQLKQIPVGDESLYTVAFFPDGKRIAAAGLDRKIYFVDALTGKIDATLDKHPDYLYRLAFNRAGTRLLSCGYGGNVMVWNAANGQSLLEEKLNQVTNSAAFSPDGARIVVAGGDGQVRFFDLPANVK